MLLQCLIWLFMLIGTYNGQIVYSTSETCPGNLKWNSAAITIIGNGRGSAASQLSYPEGLFMEPKTQILYVADVENNRVQKYYPNGEIRTAAGQANGRSGSTPDMLDGPLDTFADEHENVYIADWSNQRIQYWTKNAKSGRTVAGDGTRGSTLSQFSYPSRVLVDSKKNIIVADTQNERITRWPFSLDPKSINATIIAGGNGAGINPYQLNTPMGLYLDEGHGILYISNEDSGSITQWFLGDYMDRNIYAGIPGRPGNSAVQLNNPQGVTFDQYGNLYVADCDNHRIQMFCPNSVVGITVAGTGRPGDNSSELHYPRGVTLDSQLNLYVSDSYNNRVQKFQRIV